MEINSKSQINSKLLSETAQRAKRSGQRATSGRLPEAARSRTSQGGSISSTASSSGCSSVESAILDQQTARLPPPQPPTTTTTSINNISGTMKLRLRSARIKPSDDELNEDDDGPSSLEVNESLYIDRSGQRPDKLPSGNLGGRATSRCTGRRSPRLHRAATFVEREGYMRKPFNGSNVAAAPMSEFSAFTLRKSFKSNGGLLLNGIDQTIASSAIGPGFNFNAKEASICGASLPVSAKRSGSSAPLKCNREGDRSYGKPTPIRRSATIKLCSSGSRDNKLRSLRSGDEHFYCCCCAGHCDQSPAKAIATTTTTLPTLPTPTTTTTTTAAAGNSLTWRAYDKVAFSHLDSKKRLSCATSCQQSAASGSPGAKLEAFRERRCGVQRHLVVPGTWLRRPLPVAPPVVPLYKEMALFGDKITNYNNNNEPIDERLLRVQDGPGKIASSDDCCRSSSSITHKKQTAPSSQNRLSGLSGSSLDFEFEHRSSGELQKLKLNELEGVAKKSASNAPYSDNWHQQLGDLNGLMGEAVVTTTTTTTKTCLKPHNVKLSRSQPHLVGPKRVAAGKQDDGRGSSVAACGEEQERSLTAFNNLSSTIGRRTAGRLIGRLRQSFLFNLVAVSPNKDASSRLELELDEAAVGGTSSSLRANNHEMSCCAGKAAATPAPPACSSSGAKGLLDDDDDDVVEQQPIYDTPESEYAIIHPMMSRNPTKRVIVRPAEPPPPPPPPPPGANPKELSTSTNSTPNGDLLLQKGLRERQRDCAQAAQSQWRARLNDASRAKSDLAAPAAKDSNKQVASLAGGCVESVAQELNQENPTSRLLAKDKTGQVSAVTSSDGKLSNPLNVGPQTRKVIGTRELNNYNHDDSFQSCIDSTGNLTRHQKLKCSSSSSSNRIQEQCQSKISVKLSAARSREALRTSSSRTGIRSESAGKSPQVGTAKQVIVLEEHLFGDETLFGKRQNTTLENSHSREPEDFLESAIEGEGRRLSAPTGNGIRPSGSTSGQRSLSRDLERAAIEAGRKDTSAPPTNIARTREGTKPEQAAGRFFLRRRLSPGGPGEMGSSQSAQIASLAEQRGVETTKQQQQQGKSKQPKTVAANNKQELAGRDGAKLNGKQVNPTKAMPIASMNTGAKMALEPCSKYSRSKLNSAFIGPRQHRVKFKVPGAIDDRLECSNNDSKQQQQQQQQSKSSPLAGEADKSTHKPRETLDEITDALKIMDPLERRRKSIQNGDVFIYPSLYKDLDECHLCSRDNRVCSCNIQDDNDDDDDDDDDDDNDDDENEHDSSGNYAATKAVEQALDPAVSGASVASAASDKHPSKNKPSKCVASNRQLEPDKKWRDLSSAQDKGAQGKQVAVIGNNESVEKSVEEGESEKKNDDEEEEEEEEFKTVYKISIATASIDQKSNQVRISAPKIIVPSISNQSNSLQTEERLPLLAQSTAAGRVESVATSPGACYMANATRSPGSPCPSKQATNKQGASVVVLRSSPTRGDIASTSYATSECIECAQSNPESSTNSSCFKCRHASRDVVGADGGSLLLISQRHTATPAAAAAAATTTTNPIETATNEGGQQSSEQILKVETKVTAISIGSPTISPKSFDLRELLPPLLEGAAANLAVGDCSDDYSDEAIGRCKLAADQQQQQQRGANSLLGQICDLDGSQRRPPLAASRNKQTKQRQPISNHFNQFEDRIEEEEQLTCNLCLGDSIKITSASIRIDTNQLQAKIPPTQATDATLAAAPSQHTSIVPIQSLSARRRNMASKLSRQAIDEDDDYEYRFNLSESSHLHHTKRLLTNSSQNDGISGSAKVGSSSDDSKSQPIGFNDGANNGCEEDNRTDVLEYSPILTSARDYINNVNSELQVNADPASSCAVSSSASDTNYSNNNNNNQALITTAAAIESHPDELDLGDSNKLVAACNAQTSQSTCDKTIKVLANDDTSKQIDTANKNNFALKTSTNELLAVESPKKSIFDGASRDEILEYLEDARERVPEILMAADDVMVIGVNELIVVNQLEPNSPAIPISIEMEAIEMIAGETSSTSAVEPYDEQSIISSPDCILNGSTCLTKCGSSSIITSTDQHQTTHHPNQLRQHLQQMYESSKMVASSSLDANNNDIIENAGDKSISPLSDCGEQYSMNTCATSLDRAPTSSSLLDQVEFGTTSGRALTSSFSCATGRTLDSSLDEQASPEPDEINAADEGQLNVAGNLDDLSQLGGSFAQGQAIEAAEVASISPLAIDAGSSVISPLTGSDRLLSLIARRNSSSEGSSHNHRHNHHHHHHNQHHQQHQQQQQQQQQNQQLIMQRNRVLEMMLHQQCRTKRSSLSSSSSSPPSSASPSSNSGSSSSSSQQTSGNCSAASTFYASSSLSCSSPLLALSNLVHPSPVNPPLPPRRSCQTSGQVSSIGGEYSGQSGKKSLIERDEDDSPQQLLADSNLLQQVERDDSGLDSDIVDRLISSGLSAKSAGSFDHHHNQHQHHDQTSKLTTIQEPSQIAALSSDLPNNSDTKVKLVANEQGDELVMGIKLEEITDETMLKSSSSSSSSSKNNNNNNLFSTKSIKTISPIAPTFASSANLMSRTVHSHYATMNRLNSYFVNRNPVGNLDSTIEFQCLDCDQFIDVDQTTVLQKANAFKLLKESASSNGKPFVDEQTITFDNNDNKTNNLNGNKTDLSDNKQPLLTNDQLDRAYIAAMNGLPLCKLCEKKRIERKEIISEFVETELKYGRDLKIIRDEFYRPMQIAGLLSKEQINGVFLNLEELIMAHCRFADRLEIALREAHLMGDIDYNTVNMGRLFANSAEMLHAFESYCIRQGPAACLLARLAKEKELLRIFLRVSQMENTLLRRMNLAAFLMVPVQRVTKYPLLLNRLYKVTAYHHKDREALRDAQLKVELHLEHINQQTKGFGATNKIWRRISNLSAPISNRRGLINAEDIGYIKLRKTAMDMLKWDRDETQFIHSGKLNFAPLSEFLIKQKMKPMRYMAAHALLVVLGKPNWKYRPDLVKSNLDNKLITPTPGANGIKETALLLFREKNGRFIPCREPLFLSNCVLSNDCSQFNSECPLNLPSHHGASVINQTSSSHQPSSKIDLGSQAANKSAATSNRSKSGSSSDTNRCDSQNGCSETAQSRAGATEITRANHHHHNHNQPQQLSTDQSSIDSVSASGSRKVSLADLKVSSMNGGDAVSMSSLKSLPEDPAGCLSSSPPAPTSRSYSLASALPRNTFLPVSSSAVGSNASQHKQATTTTSPNLTILNQLMTKVNSYHHHNKQSSASGPKSKTSSSPSSSSSLSSTAVAVAAAASNCNHNGKSHSVTNSTHQSSASSSSSSSQAIPDSNNQTCNNSSPKQASNNPGETHSNNNNSLSANRTSGAASISSHNTINAAAAASSDSIAHYNHHYFHNHHQPYGDYEESFEIHERLSKESMLMRADTPLKTRYWLQMLRYHAKDLGQWRTRRNGLANIMMMRHE